MSNKVCHVNIKSILQASLSLSKHSLAYCKSCSAFCLCTYVSSLSLVSLFLSFSISSICLLWVIQSFSSLNWRCSSAFWCSCFNFSSSSLQLKILVLYIFISMTHVKLTVLLICTKAFLFVMLAKSNFRTGWNTVTIYVYSMINFKANLQQCFYFNGTLTFKHWFN